MYGTKGYSKAELIELIEINFPNARPHEMICIETYGDNEMQSFMFTKHLDENPKIKS